MRRGSPDLVEQEDPGLDQLGARHRAAGHAAAAALQQEHEHGRKHERRAAVQREHGQHRHRQRHVVQHRPGQQEDDQPAEEQRGLRQEGQESAQHGS